MNTSVERYSELFNLQKRNFTVVDGVLYICENHIVRQFAPTSEQILLEKRKADLILKELGGYIFIGQTEISDDPNPEWYAVVCDAGFSVEDYPLSKTRFKVNRSLRRGSVRKVTAEEIIDQAFEVMTEALKDQHYNLNGMKDKRQYQDQFLQLDRFQDIVDIWGVFLGAELVGIVQNYKFGQLEVNYSSLKFTPRLLSECSSYGVLHAMNEYYLKDSGIARVNDGYRNIYHKTSIQEVLQKYFHFYKQPMKLRVHFRQPLGFMLRVLHPLRSILGSMNSKAEALFLLDSISRKYEKLEQ